MHRAKKRIAWAVVALSTLAILVATLRSQGGALAPGWSFSITSGDAALAELIQNLLLFLPLGVSLTLAGVRPRRAIALGVLLSFAVEFAQQWIPGRDPSTGDILCNSISTALGVTLVRFAPRWLTTPPRRLASARHRRRRRADMDRHGRRGAPGIPAPALPRSQGARLRLLGPL